ncbi:hypothetical protein AVEN_33154-1 [Araneus ventricosus]|uniref:Uncharacterized protein n=1 Tax=Araneus ventricosus TaxID=182803 RepID=A0A4Y2LFT8_ARAVE|nr:hypothetical protein AVEN_33154-1 [Araneus ventricosus]
MGAEYAFAYGVEMSKSDPESDRDLDNREREWVQFLSLPLFGRLVVRSRLLSMWVLGLKPAGVVRKLRERVPIRVSPSSSDRS